MEINSPDILWGQRLDEAIDIVKSTREFLIDGFLYKKSTQMIYAPDGAGKSVITLQTAIQGTISDNMVFGGLHVQSGFKTLYIQAERSIDENLERLKIMRDATKFDSSNFILYAGLQGINLRNETHSNKAIENIKFIVDQTLKSIDLIVLDPIYAMVRGGLKDDEGAAYVTEFSRLLQAHFGCSILLVHHANRGSRDRETGARIGQDMFGSRFLSAHCTGVYNLDLKEDGSGVTLKLEKSSNANLDKLIELDYDPESGLSWMKSRIGNGTKMEQLNTYLNSCKLNKTQFTFSDIMVNCRVSHAHLRKLLVRYPQNHLKIASKDKYGKKLYEMT